VDGEEVIDSGGEVGVLVVGIGLPEHEEGVGGLAVEFVAGGEEGVPVAVGDGREHHTLADFVFELP
jgi:hypothetical protein